MKLVTIQASRVQGDKIIQNLVFFNLSGRIYRRRAMKFVPKDRLTRT